MLNKLSKIFILLTIVASVAFVAVNYSYAQQQCPGGAWSQSCGKCVSVPVSSGPCSSPSGGQYNSCGDCACPSGKVNCSGQCKDPAPTGCLPGQVYNSCSGCTGKQAVVLGPDTEQTLAVDKPLININRQASSAKLFLIKEQGKEKFTINNAGQVVLGQLGSTPQGISLTSGENLLYGLLNSSAVGNALMIQKQTADPNNPQTLFTLDPNGNVATKGDVITTSGKLAGSQFCFGADCKSAWSQISGPWATVTGTNSIAYNNNVGIGVGSVHPTGKLHVAGAESTSEGKSAAIVLENKAFNGGVWNLRVGAQGTTTPAGGFSIEKDGYYGFVMNNNGNIGVGTTSPARRLHIVGTGGTANEALRIEDTFPTMSFVGTGVPKTWGMRAYSDGLFFLEDAVNANVRLAIKPGGNVGIGTTEPTQKLQVSGNTALMGNVGIGTVNPTTALNIKGSSPTNAVLLLQPSEWNSIGDYGTIQFGDANHYIQGEFGTGMTVYDANQIKLLGGNVGIGTTNPQNKLQVEGNLHLNGNSIFLRNGPTDQYDLIKWNSTWDRIDIGGYNGTSIGYTSSAGGPNSVTPVLTVQASGNVGISTNNAPVEAKLDVRNTNSATAAIRASNTSGGPALDVHDGWIKLDSSLAGTITNSTSNNSWYVVSSPNVSSNSVIIATVQNGNGSSGVKDKRSAPGAVNQYNGSFLVYVPAFSTVGYLIINK